MAITQNRSVHKYYIKLFLAKFALKKQGLKALLLLCFKYGPQWTRTTDLTLIRDT